MLVKNEFDDSGNPVTRTYDIGGGGQVRVDFGPDGKPGLPSIEHADGTTTQFRIDANGALIGEHRATDGNRNYRAMRGGAAARQKSSN